MFDTFFKSLLEFYCGTPCHQLIGGIERFNKLLSIGITVFGTVSFTDLVFSIGDIRSLADCNIGSIYPFSID